MDSVRGFGDGFAGHSEKAYEQGRVAGSASNPVGASPVASAFDPIASAPSPDDTDALHNCDYGKNLSEFPWPVPKFSTKVTIPRRLLLGNTPDEQATLKAVADRLESALLAADYRQYSYHHVGGCYGFALITKLERIDDAGRPIKGEGRFAGVNAPKENDGFLNYIASLFYVPPGHYRTIVFIATDRPIEATEDAPSEEALDLLVTNGDAALPDTTGNQPFARTHALTALVYEFKVGSPASDPFATSVETLSPSRLNGVVHLERAGIYRNLQQK